MGDEEKRVDRDYQQALEDTGNDYVAAAILTLAKVLGRVGNDYLSHEICMGIRKGMFGSHADDNSSILELKKN